MKITLSLERWRLGLVGLMLIAPVLVACAKSDVSVPIHGVNYRAEAFSYVLVDPTNPKNTGGGELIEPFSAGGTMCCYTLPAKWRPGLNVEVRETYWLLRRSDDSVPSVFKKHQVEVSQYVAGEAGELWIIRAPNGNISLISSNYPPDHAKWPGKLKGWPVPGAEYQRNTQDMYIKRARESVELFVSSLKELEEDPSSHSRGEWEMAKKYEPSTLKSYAGPDDPAYLERLRKKYVTSLADAREKLRKNESSRP